LFRLADAGECCGGSAEANNVFENGVLLFPIEEVSGRVAPAPMGRHVRPQRDEAIRLLVRQRVEQDRIHDAEYRSVRADAER
jgi:hypothetical protein